MKNIVFTITLFSVPLFFGVTSLLGITYAGTDSGSLYRNYCILVFAMSMTFIFFGKKNYSTVDSGILTYFVMFLYVFIGYVSGFTKDSLWLTLVAFSLPATCIGKHYAKERSDKLFMMAKYLDVLFVVLSLCVAAMFSRLSIGIIIGDSDYSQRLSYYAALCFLLDIFLSIYGNNYERMTLFQNKFVRLIYYCLLPVFVGVIFFSGGRGGFVVVAVGTIAIAFLYRGLSIKNVLLGSIVVIAVTSLLTFFLDHFFGDIGTQLERNTNRVLAYINTDDLSIDMSQTSGRDYVYRDSWNMFLENPLTGYGLFNYKELLKERLGQPYPHNLFLEWLLQGGIFFFFIWIYAFSKMLIRIHSLIKQDTRYVILLPFLVYSLVKLMFSGTYMGSSFFWFVISFALNKNEIAVEYDNYDE